MEIFSKKLCYLNATTKENEIFISTIAELQVFLHLDYEIDRESESKALLDYQLSVGKNEKEVYFIIECIYEILFSSDKNDSIEELVNSFISYLQPHVLEIIHLFIVQSINVLL